MPDTKITALAAITTVDPAADVLPIVDISDTSMAASGTTKKITSNQILGAGGTATLASATITGDLTVDTSTLKVDSANNRVGVLTATPRAGFALDVLGNVALGNSTTTTGNRLKLDCAGTAGNVAVMSFAAAGTNKVFYGLTGGFLGDTSTDALIATDAPGAAIRFYVSDTGTEAMRLNSTGLGVGVVPSAGKFEVQESGTGSGIGGIFASTASGGGNPGVVFRTASTNRWSLSLTGSAGAESIRFYDINNSATRMTLDASGNLLVGTANASVTSETGCRLLPNNGAAGHFTLAVTTNQSTAATSCYDFYSTSAAAYRFYVTSAGVINATNTTISAISDARLKENVQDIDVGLGAILALKPRKFDWKAGKGKDIKGDRGFIAQEFEQVFPQLVDEWKDAAPEGEAPYKSVRQDLIPVLVKAIQELTARVQTLETR